MAAENPSGPGATAHHTVAVLLAAGAGSRFHDIRHKLLSRLPDSAESIAATALQRTVDAALGHTFVVTGALDETALRRDPALAALFDRDDVSIRHNPRWASGQSTSLQAGIEAADTWGATAAVVGLADQPFVEAAAWRRVANGLGPIAVATYDGRRGNPVKLHADMWGLLPTSGDEGARVVMRRRPDLVVEVPCTGSPADIDTVEDLHRWQSN